MGLKELLEFESLEQKADLLSLVVLESVVLELVVLSELLDLLLGYPFSNQETNLLLQEQLHLNLRTCLSFHFKQRLTQPTRLAFQIFSFLLRLQILVGLLTLLTYARGYGLFGCRD